MKSCKIEIVTFTRGERMRFAADGVLEEREAGFTAHYPQESDRARLTLDGGSLLMQRSGESELRALFREGEHGHFHFGIGENAGAVPMHTEVCSATRSRDGWRIGLKYRLKFGEENEIFRLKIAVNIISEEQ